jgi:hypothetical protein
MALMLYDERRTLCISSQAGCAMGCTFCATDQGDLAQSERRGDRRPGALFCSLPGDAFDPARNGGRATHVCHKYRAYPVADVFAAVERYIAKIGRCVTG